VPHALPAGSVDSQLSLTLAWLNAHEGAAANAHAASAISATPHSFVSTTSVQAQLQEIATDLQSQANPASGASLVGNDAQAGTPYALSAGSVRDQIRADAQHLNTHASSSDHDARYLREVFRLSDKLAANETKKYTTLDDFPQVIQLAYSYVGTNGWPEATTYVQGALNSQVRCWMTKVNVVGNSYDCELWVQNLYSAALFITVGAYRVA
jgi:hypothetical protein